MLVTTNMNCITGLSFAHFCRARQLSYDLNKFKLANSLFESKDLKDN